MPKLPKLTNLDLTHLMGERAKKKKNPVKPGDIQILLGGNDLRVKGGTSTKANFKCN